MQTYLMFRFNVTNDLVKAPILEDMDDYFFEVALDSFIYLPFNFKLTYK